MTARYYIIDLEDMNTTHTDDAEIAEHYCLSEQFVVIDTEKNVLRYQDNEDEIEAATK